MTLRFPKKKKNTSEDEDILLDPFNGFTYDQNTSGRRKLPKKAE